MSSTKTSCTSPVSRLLWHWSCPQSAVVSSYDHPREWWSEPGSTRSSTGPIPPSEIWATSAPLSLCPEWSGRCRSYWWKFFQGLWVEFKREDTKNKTDLDYVSCNRLSQVFITKQSPLLWCTTPKAGQYMRPFLLALVFLRLFGTQNMKHNTVVREWCLE